MMQRLVCTTRLFKLRPALVLLPNVEHSIEEKHSEETENNRGGLEADREIHNDTDDA